MSLAGAAGAGRGGWREPATSRVRGSSRSRERAGARPRGESDSRRPSRDSPPRAAVPRSARGSWGWPFAAGSPKAPAEGGASTRSAGNGGTRTEPPKYVARSSTSPTLSGGGLAAPGSDSSGSGSRFMSSLRVSGGLVAHDADRVPPSQQLILERRLAACQGSWRPTDPRARHTRGPTRIVGAKKRKRRVAASTKPDAASRRVNPISALVHRRGDQTMVADHAAVIRCGQQRSVIPLVPATSAGAP